MSQNPSRDEQLLIDCILGCATPEEAREAQERLAQEESLHRLKVSLDNTFAALDLLPEVEAPADLASRTAARVALVRAGEAYVARRESARPWTTGTFSLRELVAVAACILLLVAVFVPSLRQARRAALQNQCASNVGQIGTALSAYASQNEERLPSVLDEKAQWLRAGGQPAVSNSAALFRLVKGGLAAAPAFQCPAVGGGTFAVQDGMNDFPGTEYVQVSYQHTASPEGPLRRDQFSPAEAESMVILADQSPLFLGGSFHPEAVGAGTSPNHGGAGQNVLYLNAGVRFVNNPNVGVGQNNIFLAGNLVDYRGDERPVSRTDTFLTPAYSPKP